MTKQIDEIKKIFPSSKEIVIAGKTIFVKPMVWKDFLMVIEDFGKIYVELMNNHPDLDLEKFTIKDLGKILPIINEIFNIGAKWLGEDSMWLKENLTPIGTVKLIDTFLDVNEWGEVQSYFLVIKNRMAKGKE